MANPLQTLQTTIMSSRTIPQDLSESGITALLKRQLEQSGREPVVDLGLADRWRRNPARIPEFKTRSTYRLKLWRMMIHLYGCTPYDLFSWGLRPSIDEDDKDGLFREVCEILPHPMFKGKLDFLRYTLQKTVSLRFRNHVGPVGPIEAGGVPIEELEKIADRAHRSNKKGQGLFLELWIMIANDMEKRHSSFFSELRRYQEPKVRTARLTMNNVEAELFLTKDDIHTIRRCLDNLKEKGEFAQTVDEYYISYLRDTTERWNTMSPSSKTVMARWEKYCILTTQRGLERACPDVPMKSRRIYTAIPYWISDNRYRNIHSTLTRYSRML